MLQILNIVVWVFTLKHRILGLALNQDFQYKHAIKNDFKKSLFFEALACKGTIRPYIYLLKELLCPWHVLQEPLHLHNDDFVPLNGEGQSNLYHQYLASHLHLRLDL